MFYYETNEDLKMNFSGIGKSGQKLTIYLKTQEPSTFFRLPDSNLDEFKRNELNGRFYNDETETSILIEFDGNNQYWVTKNGKKRQAELVVKDLLKMNSYEITVLRNNEDQVTGLSVKNGRIKNVIFKKVSSE